TTLQAYRDVHHPGRQDRLTAGSRLAPPHPQAFHVGLQHRFGRKDHGHGRTITQANRLVWCRPRLRDITRCQRRTESAWKIEFSTRPRHRQRWRPGPGATGRTGDRPAAAAPGPATGGLHTAVRVLAADASTAMRWLTAGTRHDLHVVLHCPLELAEIGN